MFPNVLIKEIIRGDQNVIGDQENTKTALIWKLTIIQIKNPQLLPSLNIIMYQIVNVLHISQVTNMYVEISSWTPVCHQQPEILMGTTNAYGVLLIFKNAKTWLCKYNYNKLLNKQQKQDVNAQALDYKIKIYAKIMIIPFYNVLITDKRMGR